MTTTFCSEEKALGASDSGLPVRVSSKVPLDKECTTEQLRARCPLPVLMRRMGLGRFAKRNCPSPFRRDEKPSWGIFPREDRWFWKDHGTGESGDEINFIVRAKKLKPARAFREALEYWEAKANEADNEPQPDALPTPEPRPKPDASHFGPGSDDQLVRLSKLRKIDLRGLLVAQDRGLLVFGTFIRHEVYGLKDSSGNVLELRRLDGEPFSAHGPLSERKSHAVKGSLKSWPVGIANAGERPMILLVEGLPDLLAAFEVVVAEGALDRVAPVAMLSAGSSIASDALPLFKGRHVLIVPHADKAGRDGATRWKEQLVAGGAAKVDFYSLTDERDEECSPIKDLNDYLPIYRMETADGSTEGRIL